MTRLTGWGAIVCLMGFLLPVAAQQDDALMKRIAELEALVKQQQATIEGLKKQNGSSEENAALKKRIEDLESLVSQLQSTLATLQREKPQEVEPPAPTAQPAIPTLGSEKLLPDISFIIDSVGKVASRRSGDPDRNRYLVREAEFAMQGYLYPNIRGDVFFNLEREPGATGFNIALEEAFASFLNLGKGFQLQAGKKLLDFGRLNRVHPERWLTTDLPLPNKHFLFPEDHGLAGQGIQLNYLLPIKGVFGQLQLGFWRGDELHAHEHEEEEEAEPAGLGIHERIYSGRLSFSKGLSGGDAELGVGFSGLFGHSEPVRRRRPRRIERDDIRLLGMDVVYRRYYGAYKRLLLQGELMQHRRSGPEGDSRLGYYLLGAYRWDRYWDGGVRYDSSSLPAPLSGHETKVVAFVRRFLTERSYLRFQLERSRPAGQDPFTLFSVQFVWGIGPHAHFLE
ncbi:MAG: hypothetical protein NZT92_05575 [Abditibacteriales bacterium]|nr:hypothetical protein [Abditibacteriales bacterium]MDW8365570.1 hypothetical protein [Abditibacteriales bacterium]